MNINNNYNQGFTLIEALIAIFIFSVALVSLITITAKGVTGTVQARDQVTAQFLAQEGVELMRNYRDTRIINENINELVGGSDPMLCDLGNECSIERTGGTSQYALNANVSPYLTPDNNGLHYEATNAGRFYRRVWYRALQGVDEIEVHSEVTWSNGSIPRSVHLVTVLKNWGRHTNP